MSNSGGGGGGAARVTIPESVRKTIQSIREITGKQHSDEDIYSVLRDCSMDPNDTAQKLLYLDTFHEVKRKRDRKKEMPGTQGRGARGGRGNHSPNHAYPDAVGGRNAAPRRENGASHMTERAPPTAGQKTNNKAVTETRASTVTPNGPSSLPNGGSSLGHSPESPARGVVHSMKDGSDIDNKKPDTVALLPTPSSPATNQISEHMIQVQQGKPTSSSNDQPTSTISASVPGVYSSASDPVLAPAMTRISGAIGAIKREVGSQRRAAGPNHIEGNNHVSHDVGSELSKNERSASTIIHSVTKRKVPGKSKENEKNESSETLQPSLPADDTSLAVGSSSSSQDSDIPLKVSCEDAHTDDGSCLLPVQTVTNGHVTFPNHFKVPEALKSGLTFGSFDVNSGPGTKNSNGNGCDINSTHAIESSHGTDETARETSSSNQNISSTVLADHPDQLESPEQVFEKATKSEGVAASAADPKSNKASQEMMLLPEGQENSVVQIAPNYGFGIMSTVPGGQLVQIDGYESQTQDVSRLSGFVNEYPTASSIPSPSPSPPVQNSVSASPQPVVFRPPYPPSYFPYGHFFNPYFIPPMHQFLSHNGIAQQPSAGNAYLTPAATAPGVKFPLQQFKPGTSTGNPTPIGMQPIYGSYGSSPVSFNPVPAATSGSPASNEDVSASQLKESQIYTTGPLNDGSAWISPPGQELSSLHLNSLYHITPQGQHLAFSPAQAGHGPYPGIYPPVQAIAAAPSTVNPHLQQPQAVSAAVETSAHPSSAYQQSQLGQINWNSY